MRTPADRKLYVRNSNDEFMRLLRIPGAEGQPLSFFIARKHVLLPCSEQIPFCRQLVWDTAQNKLLRLLVYLQLLRLLTIIIWRRRLGFSWRSRHLRLRMTCPWDVRCFQVLWRKGILCVFDRLKTKARRGFRSFLCVSTSDFIVALQFGKQKGNNSNPQQKNLVY